MVKNTIRNDSADINKDIVGRGKMKIDQITKKIRILLAKQMVARGEKQLKHGLIEESIKSYIRSFNMCNDLNSANSLLCRILMPGDDYITLLSRFHDYLNPRCYVEIGVFSGKSLAVAGSNTKAVGIDPSLQISKKISSRTKLFPLLSDDFFKQFNLLEELSAETFELGFIDGSHLFEDTLRDFVNLERFSNENTIIIVHDCLPITRLAATRIRQTSFWSGDVWKLIPCLRKYRPDLKVHVVPSRPSGLGIITNLNSKSVILSEKYDQLVKEYLDVELDYDYLDFNKMEKLALMPNEWTQIVKAISI